MNDYTRCVPLNRECPLANCCLRWIGHDEGRLAKDSERVSVADLSVDLTFDSALIEWGCRSFVPSAVFPREQA